MTTPSRLVPDDILRRLVGPPDRTPEPSEAVVFNMIQGHRELAKELLQAREALRKCEAAIAINCHDWRSDQDHGGLYQAVKAALACLPETSNE